MEGAQDRAGRKRGREATGTSPLSRLLDQLRRLKLPSISGEDANLLLGPLVLDCLKLCNDSTLTEILCSFGWQDEAFTGPVNLFGLATALAKYRWVRVQVRRPKREGESLDFAVASRSLVTRGKPTPPWPRAQLIAPGAPARAPTSPGNRRSWAADHMQSCTRPRTEKQTRSSR